MNASDRSPDEDTSPGFFASGGTMTEPEAPDTEAAAEEAPETAEATEAAEDQADA